MFTSVSSSIQNIGFNYIRLVKQDREEESVNGEETGVPILEGVSTMALRPTIYARFATKGLLLGFN